MKKYKGIFLADIHIGDMPRDQLKQEFEEVVYPFLETHDLDFVIFCGDYFGHKLYLNDENTVLASMILQEIDKRLKPDAKIRMVYGTESHEENQYGPFKGMLDRDFKVIKTFDEEELFPDMLVVYIPEEMLEDPDDYYATQWEITPPPNLVVGHGTIREAMQKAASSIEDKKNVKRRVPVFRTGDLRSLCKGLVVFGHYHVHTVLDPMMMYVGSFSRWKFGEEEAKGFLYAEYDVNDHTWTHEFIENTYTPVYKTIGFGYQNTIFESMDELKKKMDYFEKLTQTTDMEHLKMEFNVPETCDNPEYVMEFLRERFKRVPNIKVNITNGYIEKKRQENQTALTDEYEKYAPIFDPNTEMEDRVSYFIDVEYDKEIPRELTALYLYSNLQDILNYKKKEPESV